MSYTFDLSTDTGKVRLLVPDVKPGRMRYTDEELAALLELEDRVPKRAAALALETMACSKAASLAYVETNAIKVDGTKPAEVLLKRAVMLRAQCALPDIVEDEDEWDFTDLADF